MYDLAGFPLKDMTACGSALRRVGPDATTMEEAARRMVTHLYDNLGDPRTGMRACALVRLYKTHAYGELTAELRSFAASLSEAPLDASTRCLTLLATVGDVAAWR